MHVFLFSKESITQTVFFSKRIRKKQTKIFRKRFWAVCRNYPCPIQIKSCPAGIIPRPRHPFSLTILPEASNPFCMDSITPACSPVFSISSAVCVSSRSRASCLRCQGPAFCMIPAPNLRLLQQIESLTAMDVKHSLHFQQSHRLAKTQPVRWLFATHDLECEKAGVISKRGVPSLAPGFQ